MSFKSSGVAGVGRYFSAFEIKCVRLSQPVLSSLIFLGTTCELSDALQHKLRDGNNPGWQRGTFVSLVPSVSQIIDPIVLFWLLNIFMHSISIKGDVCRFLIEHYILNVWRLHRKFTQWRVSSPGEHFMQWCTSSLLALCFVSSAYRQLVPIVTSFKYGW